MSSFQYVTLVAFGGVPIRLANPNGTPFATTGTGALVFANGATLTNVTLSGFSITPPFNATAGTVTNPSIYFATTDRGLYSRGPGDVSFAANGSLMASIENNLAAFFYSTNSLQLKLFSDTASEVTIQGYDTAGAVAKQLSLQKYGANVKIGPNVALVAGGSLTNSGLYFSSSNVALLSGTGAPTVAAAFGSLYLRSDSTALPYYNTDAGTTWDQLVGRTATQTLTNKTLTSPTITGATLTTATLVSPTITGAVTGGATYATAAIAITSASATSLVVGLNGATNPAFSVDSSTALQVAGLKLTGAVTGGTVALVATDSGANTNLTLNAKGTGTIGIGSVSTGAVTITPALTLSAALTYGGVTLTNNVTGTGKMVLDTSPTLSNPLVGTQTANDNSTKAASTAYADRVLANLVIRVTVFTAGGTWTVNTNTVYATMEAWGGGGGGGGTATAAASTLSAGASGGAGSYSRMTSSKATVGTSQTITIGAAGAAGTAGNNAGGAGGDTSVGALCIGKGGSGGAGSDGSTTRVAGGAGGVAGTGDVTSVGQSGSGTAVSTTALPMPGGGSSSVGGGGQTTILAASSTGVAGTGRASGGSGGASFNASGTVAGGAGTAGYVVITEFCKQ